MITYYGLFFIFAGLSIAIKDLMIDNYVDSWLSLIMMGILTIPFLLTFYFLALFIFTRGMKYFVARKPVVYHCLCKIFCIK